MRALFDANGRPDDRHRFADAHCFPTPGCHGPRRCRWRDGGDHARGDPIMYKGFSPIGWNFLTLSIMAGSQAQKLERYDSLRFQ